MGVRLPLKPKPNSCTEPCIVDGAEIRVEDCALTRGDLTSKDSVEHERYDGALNLRDGYLKTTPSTQWQKGEWNAEANSRQ